MIEATLFIVAIIGLFTYVIKVDNELIDELEDIKRYLATEDELA